MSRLRFKISMSFDGYVAGPNQSVENPLGVGGERLHDWVVATEYWRSMHGLDGGEVNDSSRFVEEGMAGIASTIMGRNMFGGHPGPWSVANPWTGWWGANPPYHHPVFVLTHFKREPLVMEGGTTFFFITDGPEHALEQARRAAAGKDITLAGGANVAQQYLRAGLVDEMLLSVAPTLLGSGERLFEGVGDDLHGLEFVRTVAAPDVTHLFYARR